MPAQQPAALDLVPEDAAVALVVRDLAELRQRGDQFAEASNMDLREGNRPTHLFKMLFDYLKLKKGVDENGAAAIVLPNLGKGTGTHLDVMQLLQIVFIVPFTNAADILANYNLKPEDVKPGKATSANGWQILIKDKHLYIGFSANLSKVAQAKPITAALSPQQRAALAQSDVGFVLGAQTSGNLWPALLDGLKTDVQRQADAADLPAAKDLLATVEETRFIVAGMKLGKDGIDFDVIITFLQTDEGTATKFLSVLRGGPGATDLNSLPPVAHPLLVYAAKGDGVRNLTIARMLLRLVLRQTPGVEQVIPAAERQKLIEAFDEMYQRLKGSRAVLYATGQQDEKVGVLAVIGILDLDDPAPHLARWADLAEIATTASQRATPDGKPPRFSYVPQAETIDGVRVDHLRVTVPDLSAEEEKNLRHWLGADWHTLRLAVLDKGVVLLLGSDGATLRQTLKLRQSDDKGLALSKDIMAAGGRLAPERKLEFLFNLDSIRMLSESAVKAEPSRQLTATAMTIEPDRLHFQFYAPMSDVRAFIKINGMERTEE